MDVLTDVLKSLRLKSKLAWRSELTAPWGLRLDASPDITFHLVTCGSCWLRVEGNPVAIPLAKGDLVLLSQGLPHDLVDQPASPIIEVIHMSYTEDENAPLLHLGGEGALTHVLCGTVHFEAGDGPPLIGLLPPLIHIKGVQEQVPGWLNTTITFLTHEASSQLPGAEIMRGRLTDMLFVQVLRAWLEQQDTSVGGWLGALRDPQIGAALGLIHRNPERRWTVVSLAAEVGLSRSAFSARFRALVGEPPLQYLKQWRLTSAARLLRTEGMTLVEIALRVGYVTEAALSKAFKQSMGMGPRAYRRQMEGTSGLAR